MKEAKDQEEAMKVFFQHETQGFIQWKGTDVCMDFHCECGEHNHYDGYFAYEIICGNCGVVYAPSCYVEMVKIKDPGHLPLEPIDFKLID